MGRREGEELTERDHSRIRGYIWPVVAMLFACTVVILTSIVLANQDQIVHLERIEHKLGIEDK
jgi:hypothetical protein